MGCYCTTTRRFLVFRTCSCWRLVGWASLRVPIIGLQTGLEMGTALGAFAHPSMRLQRIYFKFGCGFVVLCNSLSTIEMSECLRVVFAIHGDRVLSLTLSHH
uniref:Uncharacterized protein n=1 Tax=Candidatus Kentrum sp. TUN TaxID=2126343 RepID=A0A451AG96_9GAMM|nr:MAG: hypothetical protein BECKTUN1418D_GA0071000_13122 [Candidatus Kentron sp. TUN]